MKSKNDINKFLNYTIALCIVAVILSSLGLLNAASGNYFLMELGIVEKDYSYFEKKYPDLKDSNDCVKEYSEYLKAKDFTITMNHSPCEGTAQ